MRTIQRQSVGRLIKKMGPHNCLFFLCYLISKEQWVELHRFLVGEGSHDEAIKIARMAKPIKMNKNQNLLHFVCRFRPPLSIAVQIGKIDRKYFYQPDSNGQTPLHVCVTFGASQQVINFISTQYVGAGTVRDIYGKTPLMLACIELLERKNDSSYSKVIRNLCNSREIVLQEDYNGMDAIDFVERESYHYMEILNFLYNMAYS